MTKHNKEEHFPQRYLILSDFLLKEELAYRMHVSIIPIFITPEALNNDPKLH